MIEEESIRVPVSGYFDVRGSWVVEGDTIAWTVREEGIAVLKVGRVREIYNETAGFSWERGLHIVAKAEAGQMPSHLRHRERTVRL